MVSCCSAQKVGRASGRSSANIMLKLNAANFSSSQILPTFPYIWVCRMYLPQIAITIIEINKNI